MNVTVEEIELTAKNLRDTASDLPSPHGENVLVPQFAPTKKELMVLAADYLDKSYGWKAANEDQSREFSVEDAASDPYAWRGSGILCLIGQLFGDDEQERLEREYLTPVKEKWCKHLGGDSKE